MSSLLFLTSCSTILSLEDQKKVTSTFLLDTTSTLIKTIRINDSLEKKIFNLEESSSIILSDYDSNQDLFLSEIISLNKPTLSEKDIKSLNLPFKSVSCVPDKNSYKLTLNKKDNNNLFSSSSTYFIIMSKNKVLSKDISITQQDVGKPIQEFELHFEYNY